MSSRILIAVILALTLIPGALAVQAQTPVSPAPPPPATATPSPATNPPPPTSTPSTAPAPTPTAAPTATPAPEPGNEEETFWERLRASPPLIFGLIGTVLGSLSLLLDGVRYWRDREKEKRSRTEEAERRHREEEQNERLKAIEVDRLLDQAWDHLGGRRGSTFVFDFATDPSDHELARRLICEAIRTDPKSSRAHWVKSVYWSVVDRHPEQQLVDAERAVELAPRDFRALVALGNAFSANNQLAPAIATFRRAIGINSHSVVAHNNLGNALREQGDLPAAITSFRKALEIDPGLEEAQANLARALQDQASSPTAPE